MKIIHCVQHGTPETLRLQDIPEPEPAAGEARIKVYACGVNFPDVLIIQNKYQFKPELPFAPGGEIAGIVDAVGEGVRFPKVGDRVLALSGWGGFAEKACVSAKRIFPMPPGLGFTAAATTLYTYGTSYHALKDRANLQPGETLLVLGAAGGVGLAAVELGKVMGATVIAAASSADKLAICQEKGATHVINYAEEDLRERIKALTNDQGVDVIYDPVGGALAEPALRSMAWRGRYLVVGFAAGDIPKFPLNLMLLKGCAVMGVFWGSFAEREPQRNLQNFTELLGWMTQGKISQHIHRMYALEEAPQALTDLMERQVRGKAVVKIGDWTEEPAIAAPPVTAVVKGSGPLRVQKPSELEAYKGRELGPSAWLTVTQTLIDAFAEATLDHQWIHVDAVKAAELLPGGKTIAHGYFSLSLMSHFLYKMLQIEQFDKLINYGTNKVRFPMPVPCDSRVRLHATLSNVERMPGNRFRLTIDAKLELEGAEKPACAAELMSLVY